MDVRQPLDSCQPDRDEKDSVLRKKVTPEAAVFAFSLPLTCGVDPFVEAKLTNFTRASRILWFRFSPIPYQVPNYSVSHVYF